MNVCLISGRLARNAEVVATEKVKLLRFVVSAKHGYDPKAKKPRVEEIPCVLFNPTEGVEMLFSREGKGVYVEFLGRLKEYRRGAEVMVYDRYLEIIRC